MDVTSPYLAMSKEKFLTDLASTQIISAAELELLAAEHAKADLLGLASALLKSGRLTEYQATAIQESRSKELRIGNYEILGKLGAGGMGTVYKARHRRMKRVVALKVLLSAFCNDAGFVQRFQREVETVARLGHPNVVMAYDADEDEAGHFLVMEFVDGKDLISMVENGHPIAPDVVADCIMQSARGLAYAHSQGIVHRDIKPANLLRDTSGVVKVTDLGLARLSGDGEPAAGRGITQAGGILGTVDYMAPEQAVDSTTIDHRADIYSLGATFYYLLTGLPPYDGSSIMAVLLKHREAPIPLLREKRPDVPLELEAIYTRMMAKQPANRFATMTEVVVELEKYLGRNAHNPDSSTATTLVANAPSTSTAPIGATASITTVVVEPSRVQAGFIRKYLEAQGVTVLEVVGTGADAAKAVAKHRPNVIVSAFHLPDATGLSLAKQVREDTTVRPPGFVLITSEAENEDVGSLSRLDSVMLLQKPFTAEQLGQALTVVTGRSVSNRPKVDRSTLKVLIVDDTGSARVNERIVLQGLGFTQFGEAVDGAQAIVAATQEKFDLIVTDYNMPLMDGRALVSYLKQTPASANIPILMVTTETSAEILDPVRKLGVVAVFDKAFLASSVKPVLDQLFG
jgi:serine/threonine protein kinase/CheY-like chemotaxis protein